MFAPHLPGLSVPIKISSLKKFLRYKERENLKLPNPCSDSAFRLCEAITNKYNKDCDNEEDKITSVQVYFALIRRFEFEEDKLIVSNPIFTLQDVEDIDIDAL